MGAIAAIVGSGCCCSGTDCVSCDCIVADEISEDAGCCHSDDEVYWVRIERPLDVTATHAFGDGGDPETCPGGCEVSIVTTKAAAPALQVMYAKHGEYWKIDTARKFFAPPRQPCGEPCTVCCPATFPPFLGCVCTPNAYLSPHQKSEMEGNPFWNAAIDIICYADSCSAGTLPDAYVPGPTCSTLSGATSLYDHWLCVVHLEHWFTPPEDDPDAYFPNPLAPPSGSPTHSWQCFVPRFLIESCSGSPLFSFQLDLAVARGVITDGQKCQFLVDLDNGVSNQEVLRALANAGIIGPKDHRKWIADQAARLEELMPDDFAGCATACASLDLVGPCRVYYPVGITPGCLPANASALQPSLPACFNDPWSGGPYPGEGDPDREAFLIWHELTHSIYVHAFTAYKDWVCWDTPGYTDDNIPDLPRRSSVACGGDCWNITGEPRDCTCEDGVFAGEYPPGSGLATCEFGCGTGCAAEPGCSVLSLSCSDTPGSTCQNLAIAEVCGAMHLVYTVTQFVPMTPTETCPYDYKPVCVYRNDAYVWRSRVARGDYDGGCPYKCRPVPPASLRSLMPNVVGAYIGYDETCQRYSIGCADPEDLCCGSVCMDVGDPCDVAFVAPACVASADFDENPGQVE